MAGGGNTEDIDEALSLVRQQYEVFKEEINHRFETHDFKLSMLMPLVQNTRSENSS